MGPESLPGSGFHTRSPDAPISDERLGIAPAIEASWENIEAIFGSADYPGRCQCQALKVVGWIWRDSTQDERTTIPRDQTACGNPNAAATSGLVAYVVPGRRAPWRCPQPNRRAGSLPSRGRAYPTLRTSRIPWTGRDEHKDDDGIWAVTASWSARATGVAA